MKRHSEKEKEKRKNSKPRTCRSAQDVARLARDGKKKARGMGMQHV
jgi:hypothetical protein